MAAAAPWAVTNQAGNPFGPCRRRGPGIRRVYAARGVIIPAGNRRMKSRLAAAKERQVQVLAPGSAPAADLKCEYTVFTASWSDMPLSNRNGFC